MENTEWGEFTLLMKPGVEHQYIVLEAYYETPSLEAYDRHILVDNLSDIREVPCRH